METRAKVTGVRGSARKARLVADQIRGKGVEAAFLEVRESNHGARALYRALGFEETQKRRAFYRNPVEDAVLMRLSIGRDARLKGPRNAC